VGDLLNFHPDRKLTFDSSRPLEFDPQRDLLFDENRGLGFEPNRDLGFGRRGVVFRGYVCPICGALATEDAPRCAECGAVFEPEPRAATPTMTDTAARRMPRPTPPAQGPAFPPREALAAETPRGPVDRSKFCAFCGVKLAPADEFCWNCGARVAEAVQAVRLPTRTETPVTREWRGREP
jgi:hypothetical protein